MTEDSQAGTNKPQTEAHGKKEAAGAPTLLEQVRRVCARLGPHGWGDLLKHHGLNIKAADLHAELTRELTTVDRRLDGFQDFAAEGRRGIEPGKPAHSLLFHALASPQVLTGADGRPLRSFPTPAEIEAVENYVYGVNPPSVQDLRARAGDAPLAVVVFAYEYRPAINTVHQRHADICFSRVGVSRVGTREAEYLPEARGYLPFAEGDAHGIRVLPCRYAAYISAQYPGEKESFGPMRFREASEGPRELDGTIRMVKVAGDDTRRFWVPLHKLFSGDECLRGVGLDVRLKAHHVNEKLRRVHLTLASQGRDTGCLDLDLTKPPFVNTERLADFSADPDDGTGLLVPFVHEALVREAEDEQGKPVTFKVPVSGKTFSSSINISPRRSGARSAPEYVHARHKVKDDGTIEDLNDQPEVESLVQRGGYRAKHYVDFTADGWIEADCQGLALEIPRSFAAYSLVAPPDFFPAVKQQYLMHWWKQSAPPELEGNIWPSNPGPPEALCDVRSCANFTLVDARFDEADDTYSAIVSFKGSGRAQMTRIDLPKNLRAVSLPDGAAGVFAPGWDCSIDRSEEVDPTDNGVLVLPGVTHMAGYGLGSPFPEDAKLCAALSAYWPAAAPDVTRTFEPGKYATATPLPDDIIGQDGSPPWDGIPGPRVSSEFEQEVEYSAIDYGDYVESALGNKFSITRIGWTSAEQYAARTLVMARVYDSLGAKTTPEKTEWALYSFKAADPADTDFQQAERETKRKLSRPHAYRFVIFRPKGSRVHPKNFKKVLVRYDEMVLIFADPKRVLRRKADGTWEAQDY
jgi:hypothetical protein